MGRKYSRQRKHFFLYIACWISFLLVGTGCAPYYNLYNEDPFSFPQYSEANQLLFQAKLSFSNGDFLTSLKKSQEMLNRFPQKYGGHALYMMGLIYANPEYTYVNYDISIHFFKKLVKEYPESVFKEKAKIWIWLLNQNMNYAEKIDLLENELRTEKKQIINLQNQIKRLKEIDLGIEEKKREALPAIGH
jgi:outer membrane protein assembly factor BamD (BamD/ComL family)